MAVTRQTRASARVLSDTALSQLSKRAGETNGKPPLLEKSEGRPESSFQGKLEQFQFADAAKEPGTRAKNAADQEPLSRTRSPLKRGRVDVVSESTKSPSRSASSSPSKRSRPSSKYAAPSKYAHLSPLRDILAPHLICIFIGANPGIQTATSGHAYAHPSNLFWKLLHSSGCTDRRCRPEEDAELPRLYAMGNTNIVERPTRDVGELSKAEMVAGTAVLEEKVARWRPEAVCIVGKGIWEAVWRYRHGRYPRAGEFAYGWQEVGENMGKVEGEEGWDGARVFVAASTSGVAASLKPAQKEEIWRPFGEWVKGRREER
ncbi:DNA glycosylase, partial [Eremomyces bilateralis CBS 781.70]